jgi:hypothetical protein
MEGRDIGTEDVMGVGIAGTPGGRGAPSADYGLCEIFMDNFLMREFFAAATAGMSE